MRITLLPLLLLVVLLSGCSRELSTPEGASSKARAFLQARSAGNASSMYALLTVKAQKVITKADVAQAIQGAKFRFDTIGDPLVRDAGWVQIPVRNLSIRSSKDDVKWPELLLTLHYEAPLWRVAWVEPILTKAVRAYDRTSFTEELTYAHTIIGIDPYHYRGYLEQHFAYRGLQRLREAELAGLRSIELATPVQQPDAYDAMARFKLNRKAPADAASLATMALNAASPYVPATYSTRWQADTLVVLGRAQLAQGDRAGAELTAKRANELDPFNGSLAIFRFSLNPPPPLLLP